MPRPQLLNGLRLKRITAASAVFPKAPGFPRAFVLSGKDADEVRIFLRQRPVHTVAMMSFINDNGLFGEMNRGIFYGYRSVGGELEGAALIGHTTLVEARSREALRAFAATARRSETPIKMMMSDGKNIEDFWRFFSGGLFQPRLVCEEKLFKLKSPVSFKQNDCRIRLGAESELETIAAAHAEVAFIESGVNPLETDREGFLRRAIRRIRLGRTYVFFVGERLVFKADIAAQTEDVIYLEGIYVAPDFRGRGIGSGCLSKLGEILLERAEHICLLSNLKFVSAHRMYLKAGFESDDFCTTLFV